MKQKVIHRLVSSHLTHQEYIRTFISFRVYVRGTYFNYLNAEVYAYLFFSLIIPKV